MPPNPSQPSLPASSPIDPESLFVQEEQQARFKAQQALDGSPSDAAQAVELGKSTGVDPSLIYPDTASFAAKQKAALTDEFLRTNPTLQAYVNSHPLAAVASRDDWHNLDALNESIKRFGDAGNSVIGAAAKGFSEGFENVDPFAEYTQNLEGWRQQLASLLEGPGGPGYGITMSTKVLAGLSGAIASGSEELGRQTGSQAVAKLGQSASEAIQDPALAATLGPLGAEFEVAAQAMRYSEAFRNSARASLPYLQDGKIPPPRIDPLWDQFHTEQVKNDQKNFSQILKDAEASNTSSPELLGNFIRIAGNPSVGIDAEALAKVAGDDPTKGPFAWIPNIAERLPAAVSDGGDIDVNLADLVQATKEDPKVGEIFDQLKDNVRYKPGGLTVEEAKELPKPEPDEGEEIQPGLAARAEPGDYKLEEAEQYGVARRFTIKEGDKDIGAIHATTEDAGKTIYIDSIISDEVNQLGPAAVRELGKQLIEQFPGAERIKGLRVTGSRNSAPDYAVINIRRQAGLAAPQEILDQALRQPPQAESELKLPEGVKPNSQGFNFGYGITTDTGMGWGGKVSDFINHIDPSRLTDAQAPLHDFLSDRLREAVGNVPVHVLPGAVMDRIAEAHFKREAKAGFMALPGFHSSGKGGEGIFLDARMFKNSQHAFMADTVLHEAGHALTYRALREYPELRRAVEDALKEFRAGIEESDITPDIAYYLNNADEFMAGGYGDEHMRELLSSVPISPELGKRLGLPEKGATVWDAIRTIMKQLWEKLLGLRMPDTMMDGFINLTRAFEQARQTLDTEDALASVKARQEVTPGSAARGGKRETPAERAARYGITADRLKRYMGLMEAEDAQTEALRLKHGEALEREKQKEDWKANFDTVRKETRDSLRLRPDLAADRLLREGYLYGEKVGATRLRRSEIPEAWRDKIPKEYLSENGVHPDDLSGIFGYGSGDQLIRALATLEEQRRVEELTPAAHFNRMLDAETERTMRAKYGDPEANIMEAAKDHVLTDDTLKRISEEVFALGLKSSEGKLAWSDVDVKRQALEDLRKETAQEVTRDKYLNQAGKAGDNAEKALLENRPTDAYRFKQQQYIALVKAREAGKTERRMTQFNRDIKQWSKASPPGLRVEDVVWLQDIVSRIGASTLKRSLQGLEIMKREHSDYGSLREYVEGTNEQNKIYNQDPDAATAGDVLRVADFLLDPNYRNSIDRMSVDEFNNVYDSLKSIAKWSRDQQSITVRGEKRDLRTVVDGLIDRLRAAVGGKKITEFTDQRRAYSRVFGASLLTPESWMERLDLGNRRGPFGQLITRPILEGQYTYRDYAREVAKLMQGIDDLKDTKREVANTLFRDPSDGSLIRMTRGDAYGVLQNMGNRLQRRKLLLGWKIVQDADHLEIGERMVWNWLAREVGFGPEDLARAQAIGGLFENAFRKSEMAYTSMNAWSADRITLGKVLTPWGEKDEWYHPLIPDPLRKNPKMTAQDLMDENGYRRPSPAAGYTKTRTGAIYPLDLNISSSMFKLKQILNDAAMRPAITEVSKIVFDKAFGSAFKQYYGKEYYDSLVQWLKDVAGNRSWVPSDIRGLDDALGGLQKNLSTLLIGWNLATAVKHGTTAAAMSAFEVGPKALGREMLNLMYQLPGSQSSWKFAWENSEEIRNRMQSVHESIEGMDQELFNRIGAQNKFMAWRDTIQAYGHMPVAISDLWSSAAMWLAKYKQLTEEFPNMEHGERVYLANTAVRRTHGSSLLANRPSIMRQNAFVRFIMPFYNFFNNALQRNYELAWRAKAAITRPELPEMEGFEAEKFRGGAKETAKIIGGLMAFGVIPSLIEQAMDPLPQGPQEGNLRYWSKVLTRAYPSMIPVVRDLINALEYNRDASAGLYGTFGRDVQQALNPDIYLRSPGDAFQQANRIAGVATGLTFEPVGKVGKFVFNVADGKEHPQGLGDIWKGVRRGTMQEPRR